MTRIIWRVLFLTATALPTVMECWAAWDRDPRTEPLTDLIVGYVPWELPLAAFGALAVWLVPHFWVRYRRRPAQTG